MRYDAVNGVVGLLFNIYFINMIRPNKHNQTQCLERGSQGNNALLGEPAPAELK